jgi:hypothetical protein
MPEMVKSEASVARVHRTVESKCPKRGIAKNLALSTMKALLAAREKFHLEDFFISSVNRSVN